jgi:hypothetical protein
MTAVIFCTIETPSSAARFKTRSWPEPQQPGVKFRMRAAYSMKHAADARNLLLKLHDELTPTNPSATASLAEGLEDTLTVLDLDLDRSCAARSAAPTASSPASRSWNESADK